MGGLFGLVLAAAGVNVLVGLGRDLMPGPNEIVLNPWVLGFAVMTTLVTAVVFGMTPAVRLVGIAPSHALRQQSRSATGTRSQGLVRSGLASLQLGLAMSLLVGAGVLVTSFYRLQRVDLGFRTERVLAFEVNLPTARYDAVRRAAFHEALAGNLLTVPGVTAAGGISYLPATGSYHPWNTIIRTGPLAGTSARRDGFVIQQRVVSGSVFGALGIPLLAGRMFEAQDGVGAPLRAVVSANFATQSFPGMPLEGVLGQRISAGGFELDIIGVVGDVTLDPYGARTLTVYRSHRQFADDRNWALSQVVATAVAPDRVLEAVRAAVAELDPALIVHRAAPLADAVGRGTERERFALILIGVFAAVAVSLAALGLYGVLAYAVGRRRHELAIRIALGAGRTQIRATVLRQAVIVVGAGLVTGTMGALLLGRWLASLVFQISPSDPRIFLATATMLTLVALLAAWIPARRAQLVEPRVALQDG
jgi:predicted permease